jgi:glycosyltransferase involved in cell wall biosynthesis
MMPFKISVITSTFNAVATIRDCINSILAQRYNNVEYIIIDGGSTDGTLDVIKEYEAAFSGHLRWISEKDKGIYDAWNKGIALSTGDWICFVGGDDLLLDDALENYAGLINNRPQVNFVSSQALLVRQDLTAIRKIGQPWSDHMRYFNCVTHVGSMHAKALFTLKGLYDIKYRISGDYEFFLRCRDIIKPHFMPVITAKIREGGISGRQIFRVAKESLAAKLENKSQSRVMCYWHYMLTIVKYYVRESFLGKWFLSRSNINDEVV